MITFLLVSNYIAGSYFTTLFLLICSTSLTKQEFKEFGIKTLASLVFGAIGAILSCLYFHYKSLRG